MASNGAITPLVSSGIDAFSNLYDVNVTFPKAITASEESPSLSLSVRVTDFSPPELKGKTYDTSYKGVSISKLSPVIEGKREFDITYRIDANYDFHTAMLQWKHHYVDPSGEGNLDFNSIYAGALVVPDYNFGTVKVNAYSGLTGNLSDFGSTNTPDGAQIATGWTFWYVICMEAGVPKYKREGGEALTATAKFVFLQYQEPGSTISGNQDTPILK